MSSEARAFLATVVASVLAYAVLVITLDVICKPRAESGVHPTLPTHRK